MSKKFCNKRFNHAMSLLEITLVLGLILALIAALLVGIGAFTEGSDRAKCIVNQTNVQKAMRSFMNLYEFKPGETYTTPSGSGLPGNLHACLVNPLANAGTGQGYFSFDPTCPKDNKTAYKGWTDVFPLVGVAYVSCPPPSGHVPKSTANW